MNDKIISVRILPNGYGKASKEVRDYILSLHDEIVELQQENERLNRQVERWRRIANNDYKSRCEKAIEILKVMKYCDIWIGRKRTNIIKLLNILQNGSDNNE